MTIIFVLVCVNIDLNIGIVRLFVDKLLAGIASFSQSHDKLIIISPLR